MSDWRETLAPISKSVSFVNKVKVLGCSCRIEATKMPSFRENRTSLLCAFDSGVINEDEFVLLYDINTAKSPDLPYWNYEHFDLDNLADDLCKTEFRFYKNDVYNLIEVLQLPDQFTCYNGLKIDDLEGFCMLLKRFAYPCRYLDMITRFARPVPQLCMASNLVMDYIYIAWGRLLTNLNQPWLSPVNLERFANAVFEKGAPLSNCIGFVDGTVRPVCKPGTNQRLLYNGHKKVHAIKFQSVAVPNGLVANLYGPVEGKRHDSYMLNQSDLYNQLVQYAVDTKGNVLCIYGADPAYPHRPQLQRPFQGPRITQDEKDWNTAMSKVRASVEWVFGDIINYFKFLDFKKNLKVQLSAVGKMYIVCALLQNARCCLYGSTTSEYFDIQPPSLVDYFI